MEIPFSITDKCSKTVPSALVLTYGRVRGVRITIYKLCLIITLRVSSLCVMKFCGNAILRRTYIYN